MCRAWAKCNHCEQYSDCEGSETDEYVVGFSPENDAYTCESTSECAKDRCECDASLAIEIARHLASVGGSLEDDKMNLDSSKCTKREAATSAGHNACCGDAPVWLPYNKFVQSCVGGNIR